MHSLCPTDRTNESNMVEQSYERHNVDMLIISHYLRVLSLYLTRRNEYRDKSIRIRPQIPTLP